MLRGRRGSEGHERPTLLSKGHSESDADVTLSSSNAELNVGRVVVCLCCRSWRCGSGSDS